MAAISNRAALSDRLETASRIVVKIGSALLTDRESGTLNRPWLVGLIEDIAELIRAGKQVIVVSSGSIALGRGTLDLAPGPLKLNESQAAAAIGQIHLAHGFEEALKPHGLPCAQILLTLGDTEERRRYLNARATLLTLLKLGAVPVVNENDTVATNEIRYGDNDRLAARVAGMVEADCLILFSDVDGLYTAPPGEPGATHIPLVEEITPQIEAMAGDAGSALSRGGMKTKIMAARIAVEAGCHMAIASGRDSHPLKALRNGARATWFEAKTTPVTARKRWIAGSLKTVGTLTVDDGAARALARGRSLLPAGVTQVAGTFERGDAVKVVDLKGREIARGLIAYSSHDAARLKGQQSDAIEELLGYRGRDVMIHRDDLVITQRPESEAPPPAAPCPPAPQTAK